MKYATVKTLFVNKLPNIFLFILIFITNKYSFCNKNARKY
jgi:hypothetical protein